MTSRDRVRLALAGGAPDRPPCALGFFAQSLFGAPDADELFDTDVRFVEFAPAPHQEAFSAYLEGLPPEVHVGTFAQLRTYWEWGYRPELGSPQRLTTASPEIEAVGDFLPDLAHPDRSAHIASEVRRHQDAGYAVAAAPPHLGGELFEAAYRLRGFARFMEDLLEHPALVDYLLDQLNAMLLESIATLAEAGIDVLLLDDDVAACHGLLMSPSTWRRYFKPRLAEAIRAARQAAPEILVFYHSDGDYSRIVTDLVEIGVDVINPLQPDCMEAAVVRKRLGPRPAFWGTVGTARLWDEGGPDDVRAEVHRCTTSVGGSGLLLAPAYDIDFAPRGNVEAFVEAVRT